VDGVAVGRVSERRSQSMSLAGDETTSWEGVDGVRANGIDAVSYCEQTEMETWHGHLGGRNGIFSRTVEEALGCSVQVVVMFPSSSSSCSGRLTQS